MRPERGANLVPICLGAPHTGPKNRAFCLGNPLDCEVANDYGRVLVGRITHWSIILAPATLPDEAPVLAPQVDPTMISELSEPSDGPQQLPQGEHHPDVPSSALVGATEEVDTSGGEPPQPSAGDSAASVVRRIRIGSQREPDVTVAARRQTRPVVMSRLVDSQPAAESPATPPPDGSPPPPTPVDLEVCSSCSTAEPVAIPAPEQPRVETAPDQQSLREADSSAPTRRRNIDSQVAETRHFPPPNIRAELPPEWEREVEEALGGMNVEALISHSATASVMASELAPETACQGRVVSIHHDNVFVDLGQRHQGLLSLRQFREPPQVGDRVDVQVVRFDSEEGLYQLSLPGAAVDVGNWADISEGMVVQARVTGHNKGGLECEVNSLRGFIPASQVSLYRIEDLSTCVGQSWPCVVSEADPEKRKLVLSRRAVLEREAAAARKKLLAELQPGAIRQGTVRRVQDFGVFVDLGGVDGLVHVSQLAWNRVKHPSEVVNVGDSVTVRVQKIDPDTGKISLSMKELADNPWNTAAERFPVKSSHSGKVSKLMDFGAFVELEPGVEGLIHISELDHKRVFRVKDVLAEGDTVDVQVLSVDVASRRISLSRKALLARAEAVKHPEPAEPEEAPLPLRKPPSVPLKGGRGRPSGGEKFGLKW